MTDPNADLKALESSMTPEQLDYAFALMRANGWSAYDYPPAFCWRIAFTEAIRALPTPAIG